MKHYLVCMNEDRRMNYVLQYLQDKTTVTPIRAQEELEKLIKEGKYTHLLLPIIGVDNTLTIGGTTLTLEPCLPDLKGKKIITGLVHESLKEASQNYGFMVQSYLTDAFAIDNNYITCEGIIEKWVQLTNQAIYQSNVLIVGYGKLGQILSQILSAFQTNQTIAARDPKDLIKIQIAGHKAIHYDAIKDHLQTIDTVITTVPARIIDEPTLQKMADHNCLILDVSSIPYSFDHTLAKQIGANVHLLPQIPGKIAPKTSGFLMAKHILTL